MVEGEIKNWQNGNSHGSFIIVQKLVMLNSKAKEGDVDAGHPTTD